MSDRDSTSNPSTSRRWLRMTAAGLGNVFLTPAGYVFAGAWRTGIAALLIMVAIAIAAYQVTIAEPPGLYSFGRGWPLLPQLGLASTLGVHAAWLARRPTRLSRLWRAIGGLALPLVLVLLGFAVRAFWPVSVYSVSSVSMQPSLRAGELVAVRGARAFCGAVRPAQGDAVVYMRPGGSTRYMHRVAAGPGQTVSFQSGRLLVDGRTVDRPSLGRAQGEGAEGPGQATLVEETLGSRTVIVQHLGEDPYDARPPVRIGPDQWFIMGDNRENALDSRAFGPVPSASICGVAFRILQSTDRARIGARP